ncbi:hypothetical protein AB0N81_29540 [Streptomyces sp. NPDC093510]|uniref:hypothetical protein n=1 Tax=Streptomyces sp. NPDC093510 TaxID=3155199 RepID=UPI00341AED4A
MRNGNATAGRETDGLGELVVPEDPDDPTVVGEISNRRVVAVGGVLFGICAGFVVYGVVGGDDEPERRSVPSVSVTYRVTGTGTADVSYLSANTEGSTAVETGVETAVELPWRKTVRVPLGKDPAVSVRLGEQGGEASCTLSLRGEHQQRATASGAGGRATCTAELPAEPAP